MKDGRGIDKHLTIKKRKKKEKKNRFEEKLQKEI